MLGRGRVDAAPARHLILASESPRRLELLRLLGVEPDVIAAPKIDEMPKPFEAPRTLALRLAREKALVYPGTDGFVLAADTVVAVGKRSLPGPTDPAIARKCLDLLSGRKHRVYTAVVLRGPKGTAERLSESQVSFVRLSKDQIDRYVDGGEWYGKAGGYAIQGLAASFVRAFSGSHSGVIGLPLFETAQLLRGQGWHIP